MPQRIDRLAGSIGVNFVHYWLKEHPSDRVVVLDALTYAGNKANLEFAQARTEFRFVHGDIRDTSLVERLLREEQLDTIVHFAAESHVDRSKDSMRSSRPMWLALIQCSRQPARYGWMARQR
jgi:dTDP-D-glucose 4,6-dehydratase